MEMIRLSQIVLVIALLHSHAANSACETVKLPFQPYTSSYLPRHKGRLTNPDPDTNVKTPLPIVDLTPEQLKSWNELSLMQKLDSLNRYILSKNTNYQSQIQSSHFGKDDPTWYGYCHQWSNAALDPEINDYIRNTPEATICGNLLISRGEIKEMFTGFYPGSAGPMMGTRIDHKLSDGEEAALADVSHDDVYSASAFDAHIQDSLKDGKGIVMNIAKGGEVWNQPVFQSERCEEPRKMDSHLMGKLQPCLIESKDRDVNRWLLDLCDTDTLTINHIWEHAAKTEGTDMSHNSSALALQLRMLKANLASKKKVSPHMLQAFEASEKASAAENDMKVVRESSRGLIKHLADAGEIHLKDPGLTAVRVVNRVTYAVDTRNFAPSHDEAVPREFQYLLFKNAQGKVVASQWEMEPRSRPSFTWLPTKRPKDNWGQPLRDLVEILDRCREFPEFRTQNIESLKLIQETIKGAAVPM